MADQLKTDVYLKETEGGQPTRFQAGTLVSDLPDWTKGNITFDDGTETSEPILTPVAVWDPDAVEEEDVEALMSGGPSQHGRVGRDSDLETIEISVMDEQALTFAGNDAGPEVDLTKSEAPKRSRSRKAEIEAGEG